MTPLGLHHLMARGHHYGPGPWVTGGGRADWTSVYYHRADATGIGFDRTTMGSDAVSQCATGARPLQQPRPRPGVPPLVPSCSLGLQGAVGRPLWNELTARCRGSRRSAGCEDLAGDSDTFVDPERFEETRTFLAIQENEARWWRDASVLYFQTFSKRP